MKNKKIVLRTCCVTREKLPKNELLRIVRTPEGEVKVDLTGKMNGRGAYLKRDLTVLEKTKKTKSLERQLEITISDDVYEEIKNTITNLLI